MKRNISVFIASPGDLSNERTYFRDVINQLNVGFGDGANVEFKPLGWEDTFASTGRRSQSVINEEIDKCDVFILTLYRRWGQEAPDAKPYSSYTEEEFHRALERWKKESKPEIFVFFKRVEPESEADPGPQLKKVMDFRKQLEETRLVLYRYYDDEVSFVGEVGKHLRAYVKGELPKAESQSKMVVLPIAALAEVEEAKKVAQQKMKEAKKAKDSEQETLLKLEAMQLQIAEDAAQLALEGKIEFARQKFSELITESFDLQVLYLGYEFYYRTGDLDTAQKVLEKWLNISGPEEASASTAAALGNLGNLFETQGEQDKAEEMYEKSLAIYESLGDKKGMAIQYGNLGILNRIRGERGKAEEMYEKSLAIHKSLGHKKGMANQYGNLGNFFETQGEQDKAEEMYEKSLAIHKLLDHKEGMGKTYGNLGVVYKNRGELDKAEEMYEKSLAIHKSLGHKEGMANQYGNLGNLYLIHRELDRAEEMYKKSFTYFTELNSPKTEIVSGYLDSLRSKKKG